MDQADLVFVYDYCYYIWWLGSVHSLGGQVEAEAGEYLVKV